MNIIGTVHVSYYYILYSYKQLSEFPTIYVFIILLLVHSLFLNSFSDHIFLKISPLYLRPNIIIQTLDYIEIIPEKLFSLKINPMFFIKSFVHNLNLHPHNICQDIKSLIQDYLYKNVEGMCTSSGYIISVLKIENISEGQILISGHVSFKIEYEALVLKPVVGEILDCKIVSSTKMGFFANVGPMSIFIYTHLIPQDLHQKLAENTSIRLKIIGTKINSTKIYAIGSLNDDFLGIIKDN